MSISQPVSSGSGSAIADDEVCRPLPVTALTTPTARPASGTSALTSDDLPTPDWPMSTLIRPSSALCRRLSVCAASGCLVVSIGMSSGR